MSDEDAEAASVRKWLDNEGYPLELRVAASLRDAGFRIEQSAAYEDATSRKSRELDVIATITEHNADIRLVIECKSSPKKTKPCVLFSSPAWELSGIFSWTSIPHSLADGYGLHWTSTLASSWFGRVFEREAHGIRYAHSSDTSLYGATRSLVNGCEFLCRTISHHRTETGEGTNLLLIPMLVVDSSIYEVWCDHKDGLQVERTLELPLRVAQPNGPDVRCRVMEEGAFRQAVPAMRDAAWQMVSALGG